MSAPNEARDHGCCFYTSPEELRPEQVDELIRPAVLRINESGWVWTGESCQGHPDATEPGAWTHNVKPMLRLICRQEDYGTMLALLTDACYRPLTEQERFGTYHPSGLEIWPQERRGEAEWPGSSPWREVLVYVPARQTLERDAGIRLFARFADLVVAASSGPVEERRTAK